MTSITDRKLPHFMQTLIDDRGVESKEARSKDVACILQCTDDWNGAFRHINEASLRKIDRAYQLHFYYFKNFGEIEECLNKAAHAGKIKVVWIRIHGSPDRMAGSDSISSYDTFIGKHNDLFSKIDPYARIILESCSTGVVTPVQSWLYNKISFEELLSSISCNPTFTENSWSFSYNDNDPSSRTMIFEESDHQQIRFKACWLGIEITQWKKTESDEDFTQVGKRAIYKGLDICNAIAFLAQGRMVFAPLGDVGADEMQVTCTVPLAVKWRKRVALAMDQTELPPNLKLHSGGIAFEIYHEKKKIKRNISVQVFHIARDKQGKRLLNINFLEFLDASRAGKRFSFI